MIKISSFTRVVHRSLRLPWIALLLSLLWVSTGQARVNPDPIVFNSAVYSEFIIKFHQQDSSLPAVQVQAQVNNHLSRLNQQLGISLRWQRKLASGAELVSLDANALALPLAQLIGALQNLGNVEYVVPNIRLYPLFTPDDTRYNEQWHYYEATGGINMPAAWNISTGRGAVIAVVDTGYRPHADLAANIIGGYDFISDANTARDGNGRDADARDEGDWFGWFECAGAPFNSSNSSWHGTHVAGTIAALTNNSTGVAGVAYEAKILPVRVLGRCGGSLSDIQEGMLWAAGLPVAGVPNNPNPANVINLSLGGNAACDAAMQDAINQIVASGATVVAAAGNSNANASGFTPAGCDNVLTVAATNRSGARASYSNFGTVVEVAAPGGETSGGAAGGILSTLNAGTTVPAGDSYAYYQGTSMASPHAAAVAGLLYAHNSAITPGEVTQAMVNSARPFPGSCSGCGAGIIDAAAALAAIDGGSNQAPNADFSASINGLSVDFSDLSADPDGNVVGWLWEFGDGATSTAQDPSHTYAATGSYSVTLTVTDNAGATDSRSRGVSVNDNSNALPESAFSFAVNDLRVDFTDRSTDTDGSISAWAWDFGDGNVSSAQNPSHTYAAAGSYTVSLTVTDNDGAQDSSSQTVDVVAAPTDIELQASATSMVFIKNISLSWSGASGNNVEVYRNGARVGTTANDGEWSEWRFGSGTVVYRVCEVGTTHCSNEASVSY